MEEREGRVVWSVEWERDRGEEETTEGKKEKKRKGCTMVVVEDSVERGRALVFGETGKAGSGGRKRG